MGLFVFWIRTASQAFQGSRRRQNGEDAEVFSMARRQCSSPCLCVCIVQGRQPYSHRHVRIIDSRNPEMSEFTERTRKLSLSCHSRSILMSLIYVVVLTDVVSSFDFPPTTSSLSSSARSLVRNSFPCEQPNLRLPHILNSSFSL